MWLAGMCCPRDDDDDDDDDRYRLWCTTWSTMNFDGRSLRSTTWREFISLEVAIIHSRVLLPFSVSGRFRSEGSREGK